MLLHYFADPDTWPVLINIFSKAITYSDPDYSGERWPFSLTLFLTEGCNTACPHCWRPSTGTSNHISLEKVRQVASARIPFVLLSGGEPTIHPYFSEIVAILDNPSTKLYIFTNGLLSDPLMGTLDGRKNARVIIAFLPGQSRHITERKIRTLTVLSTKGIAVRASFVVDVDDRYIHSLPDDDLTRILHLVDRAYIAKYVKTDCSMGASEVSRLNAYARYIAYKYKAEVLTCTYPNAIQKYALAMAARIMYKKPHTLCSGYPLKASLTEVGGLSDCLRIRFREGNPAGIER